MQDGRDVLERPTIRRREHPVAAVGFDFLRRHSLFTFVDDDELINILMNELSCVPTAIMQRAPRLPQETSSVCLLQWVLLTFDEACDRFLVIAFLLTGDLGDE